MSTPGIKQSAPAIHKRIAKMDTKLRPSFMIHDSPFASSRTFGPVFSSLRAASSGESPSGPVPSSAKISSLDRLINPPLPCVSISLKVPTSSSGLLQEVTEVSRFGWPESHPRCASICRLSVWLVGVKKTKRRRSVRLSGFPELMPLGRTTT